MIVFLDTMILIWWVRNECTEGQENMLRRTRWLMEDLEERGDDVMISTISVAEFLRGSPDPERHKQSSLLQDIFDIRPFDINAADVLAKAFGRSFSLAEFSERRTALKQDMLIVSIAKACGADVLYSHDSGCRSLAEHIGLEARDIPSNPRSLLDLIDDPVDEGQTPSP